MFSPPLPARIYSRQQLMDRIYPDQRSVSDRTIDSHIKKLRRKLLTITAGSELIRSVYGVCLRLRRLKSLFSQNQSDDKRLRPVYGP